MRLGSVLELAAFQIVWFACALGAAHGQSTPGILAASLFLIAQVLIREDRKAVLMATLASGLAGLVAETLAIQAGLVIHAAPWPDTTLAPAWMVALWLAFGSTLPTTARLLGSKPMQKAVVAGAVFGPLAYAAGAQLGALQLTRPEWIGYAAYASAWCAIFPGLVAIACWAGARGEAAGASDRR